jgi:EEF1A lysine methyltransferase 2
VLEVGSGNGLLLCELAKNGYDPSRLLGIDYSLGSITLSRQVAKSRGFDGITFRLCDFLSENPLCISDMQKEDGLWDLLLDKGTFDAIALAEKDILGQSPSDMYPARVSRLLRPGGLFLITCPYMTPVALLSVDVGENVACNFTEEELRNKFLVVGTGLTYQCEPVTCVFKETA